MTLTEAKWPTLKYTTQKLKPILTVTCVDYSTLVQI